MIAFTESEIFLLNTDTKNLDIIQKKEKQKIQARIYMSTYRAKQKEAKGIEQFKKERNDSMKNYRKAQKEKYMKAIANTTKDIEPIQNVITKKPEESKESKERLAKPIQPKERLDLPIQPKEPIEVKEYSQRERKPVDRLKIVQNIPKINTKKQQLEADTNPSWLSSLVKKNPNYKINDTDYVEARAYEKKSIDNQIKIITKIINQIEGKSMSQDLKANITSVFRGLNIEQGKYKTNINIFKKEMPFLDIKKIDTFVNNIIKHVKENARDENNIINSLKANINPFVNLLGRIDSYNKSYQIITKFNIELNKQYIADRSDNLVSDEDIEKITILKEKWNYNDIEETNKLITDAKINPLYQAIASVFLLMPPRRLDSRLCILTSRGLDENSLESLTSKDGKNYLVMDGIEPIRWVYTTFKTASKGGKVKNEVFGTQVFDIYPEVAKYLKQHIIKNKLKLGQYLFGKQSDYNEETAQGNFSDLIAKVMKKIFNVPGITATTLRTGASMYNQQSEGRTVAEKQEFAKAMAHSETTNQLYNKIIPKK